MGPHGWSSGLAGLVLSLGLVLPACGSERDEARATGGAGGRDAGASGTGGGAGAGAREGGTSVDAGDASPPTPGWPHGCTGAQCGQATALSAGYSHICVVSADRRVVCFGANDRGQLGRMTSDQSPFSDFEPMAVAGLGNVSEVAAGGDVTWALTSDGKLYRWGAHFGNSDFTDPLLIGSVSPVEMTAVHDVRRIVAGASGACGMTSAGGVRCWGNNECGELGVDSNNVHLADVPGVASVADLVLDESAVCARHMDGKISCWGAIAEAGAFVCAREPVTSIQGIPEARALASFRNRSCSLDAGGAVTCFNPPPGCGSLDPCGPERYVPAKLPQLQGATRLLADDSDVCGVFGDKTLRCVRQDYDFANNRWQTIVYDVPGVLDARAFGRGQNRTCALDGAGFVFCWNEPGDQPYPLALLP